MALPINVATTGISATASTGTATIKLIYPVYVAGVSAFALTSGVLNWSNVVDGQNPGWSAVPDGQNPGWSAVPDIQIPDWGNIPVV